MSDGATCGREPAAGVAAGLGGRGRGSLADRRAPRVLRAPPRSNEPSRLESPPCGPPHFSPQNRRQCHEEDTTVRPPRRPPALFPSRWPDSVPSQQTSKNVKKTASEVKPVDGTRLLTARISGPVELSVRRGGRGSAGLQRRTRRSGARSPPPWTSPGSKAGRGWECCLGRSLERGVARIPRHSR